MVLAQVQSSEGLMGLGELLAADLLRWPLARSPPSLPCGSLLECLRNIQSDDPREQGGSLGAFLNALLWEVLTPALEVSYLSLALYFLC